MSRLLPYANTPEQLRHPGQKHKQREKRDSADAVVVRNAIDLSSCNLSGLSAGAILNCGLRHTSNIAPARERRK